MYIIKYWDNNSLPQKLRKEGLLFIHRRFQEVWNIDRKVDVTSEIILRRRNLILFHKNRIIGWLGIEDDGELTNACIENGHKSIYNLIALIREAYKMAKNTYLYAQVPISNQGSAIAFLKTGMQIEKSDNLPQLIKLIYPEKSIILIKLSLDKKNCYTHNPNIKSINKALEEIRYLNNVSRILQIPERMVKE